MKRFVMALTALFVLNACAEMPVDNPDDTNSTPVNRHCLLAIDEKNEVLNRIDLDTFAMTQVAVLGTAANDIEISGDYAYVAVSMEYKLLRIDLVNGGIISLTFDPGANPYNLAVAGGRIYLSLSAANAFAVVDASSMTLLTNIALPSPGYPEGVAVDETNIYIATCDGYAGSYANGRIAVLDRKTLTFVTNVPVADNAQSVSAGADGRVFAACTGAMDTNWIYCGGGLFGIDRDTYAAAAVETNVQLFVVKRDGGFIYAIDSPYGATCMGLVVYSTNSSRVTNLLPGANLKGLDFDEGRIYVSSGSYTYASENVTIFSKSDYSMTVVSNVFGGDIALWE